MANLFDKIENKITAGKIEQGVEKLKNTPVEELSKQLEKVNREELRKKIEPDPDAPRYILTLWGIGYKFNDQL